MKETDKRRNQELAHAIAAILQGAGFDCPIPDGWDESLYATITGPDEDGDEIQLEVRISDHHQPDGGGWSESRGERYGPSDISIIAKSGTGADLDFDDAGEIVAVPLVRAAYRPSVPEKLHAIIDAECARLAAIFQRRGDAAKKASATRKAKRAGELAAKLEKWHQEVRDELARSGSIEDIILSPGMPRAFVPAGAENRKKRAAAAERRIDNACRRLFDRRKESSKK